MDDIDLQKLLAETMEETTFGEDTEAMGDDISQEMEVSVEDLVFTLRQIAGAVIDLRDIVDAQSARLGQLSEKILPHVEEHRSHLERISSNLDERGPALPPELSEKLDAVAAAAAANTEALARLEARLDRLGNMSIAMPTESASPARKETASEPATTPENAASTEQDGDASPEAVDGKIAVAVPAVAAKVSEESIRKRVLEDTSKQKSKSDYRKVTFTARLKRKALSEEGQAAEAGDKTTPATEPATENSGQQTGNGAAKEQPSVLRSGSITLKRPPPAAANGTGGEEKTEAKAATTVVKPAIARPPAAEKEPPAQPVAEPEAPPAPTPDQDGPRNTGDVPIPSSVKHCQKQVFNFKLAASQLIRAGKVPRTNAPLDDRIATLLAEKSNELLKESLNVHNRNVAKAQQLYDQSPESAGRDESLFWNDDLLSEYKKFRTEWFVHEILDKIEGAILKQGLSDHLPLLDELAMEMELGRVNVKPGETDFDAKRHRVKEGTQKPMGGDFYRVVVADVLLPGYVDLNAGETIRKAIVRVKMMPK